MLNLDGISPIIKKPCVVVSIFSGGPDSFCYTLKWIKEGCDLHLLTFNYGQKASREVEVSKKLYEKLKEFAGESIRIEHKILDISFMKDLWNKTQLIDKSKELSSEYETSIVVPIRNVVMLSIASAYAYSLISEDESLNAYVIYGAHSDDASISEKAGGPKYPDCSSECIESLQASFRICHFPKDRRLEIWSPIREGMSKAENIRKCYEIAENIIYETWSCYRDGDFHCGKCESCINRHKAFLKANIPDCTIYGEPPGNREEFIKVEKGYIHKSCKKFYEFSTNYNKE
ncbi:7-cyano-7-deazaguanine synthase [Fervidicoccus fontis]|uniref:7-cyano-7-deazaguanine synthase n=1 Tax=Fervidicoccus fontis TaxID=683846 RepID=A0A2J6N3Y5_9CREN|nr:7-cyano-7-deazaguanine synthase [Fervidicoccus fontis]MBE9390956.1 7-cyano-7-deazaguanine synthase [Fervidicoccus fontis]PMB76030.1 MAG: 7-cyano-7-deazaguanine synthase [Fervidicoccus fontis]HEW64258.1 7-cyano-7-deazaguanine synthase [Fervidicoccus fontis]